MVRTLVKSRSWLVSVLISQHTDLRLFQCRPFNKSQLLFGSGKWIAKAFLVCGSRHNLNDKPFTLLYMLKKLSCLAFSVICAKQCIECNTLYRFKSARNRLKRSHFSSFATMLLTKNEIPFLILRSLVYRELLCYKTIVRILFYII